MRLTRVDMSDVRVRVDCNTGPGRSVNNYLKQGEFYLENSRRPDVVIFFQPRYRTDIFIFK